MMFLLVVSCLQEMDYDISRAVSVPVLNALWSAAESSHDVYLCKSGAYKVETFDEPVVIECYVNGSLVSETELYDEITTRSGITFWKYTVNAKLHEKDEVKLVVKMSDSEIRSSAVVPKAPVVRLDTSSVNPLGNLPGKPSIITRDYTVTVTLDDFPGEESYYRLFSPSLHLESHIITTGELINIKDIDYIPIEENDPIFKNIPIHFPEEIMIEFPFLGASATNSTHVFSDELFENKSYCFTFFISESHYIPSSTGTGEYVTYDARFRMANLTKAEYNYLLAANAITSIFADPMAEPVVMPSNIENGLGVFSIHNAFDVTIHLENQSWPVNDNFQ